MYVGATDNQVCPIKAMLAYLNKRGKQPGPLFITKEGPSWTGAMFRAGLKSLMNDLKLDKHRYNTHSLWIGAATSASLAKLPDAHIKILGRWKSNDSKDTSDLPFNCILRKQFLSNSKPGPGTHTKTTTTNTSWLVAKTTLPPGRVNVKISQVFNVKCSLSTLNKVNVEIESSRQFSVVEVRHQ